VILALITSITLRVKHTTFFASIRAVVSILQVVAVESIATIIVGDTGRRVSNTHMVFTVVTPIAMAVRVNHTTYFTSIVAVIPVFKSIAVFILCTVLMSHTLAGPGGADAISADVAAGASLVATTVALV